MRGELCGVLVGVLRCSMVFVWKLTCEVRFREDGTSSSIFAVWQTTVLARGAVFLGYFNRA